VRAAKLLHEYRAELEDLTLSGARLRGLLVPLRTLLAHAREEGEIDWELEIELPRANRVDVSRLDEQALRRAAVAIQLEQRPWIRCRDSAMLELVGAGLRGREIAELLVSDLSLERGVVTVRDFGDERVLRVPPHTRDCLARWIERRGCTPGQLFSRDRQGVCVPGVPVTDHVVWRILRRRVQEGRSHA
jgi:site-specific recombinase XerD